MIDSNLRNDTGEELSNFGTKEKDIEKCVLRPSGIPRLVSSTTHRDINRGDSNDNSRIPLSPNRTNFPEQKTIVDTNQCYNDIVIKDVFVFPTYPKRNSRDTLSTSNSINMESGPRNITLMKNRHDRAVSEEHQGRKSIDSSYSELTNNSGSTGASTHVITSKVGSFANVRHKPGGGNIKIVERKIDFSNIEAKCGSKKNIKYKPGGGDVEIVNRRLEFSKTAEPKVNSLKNIKYQPQGGDVKIDDRKLEWNTNSKVGSFNNIKYKPGGGNVQIVDQQLPWLKYNKPNLLPDELAKIHKKSSKTKSNETMESPPLSYSNSQSSDHSR